MGNKLGQESAFPISYEYYKDGEHCADVKRGMSKRFYAACTAMQGILASNRSEIMMLDYESTIRYAYIYADELLKQENETND